MHDTPMSDLAGLFSDEQSTDVRCPNDGGPCVVSTWESTCGGYEDFRYRCTQCGHTWWVEGPDA